MNTPRIASTLALLASLTGCGTLFSARATVTPQGASAHLNTDARLVAAATGIAALAAGLRAAGSVDSHAVVPAGVHAPTSATTLTAARGGQNTSTSGSLATVSATPPSAVRTTLQIGRVGSVSIERMTTVGEDDDVVAGGAIVLEGAPLVEGGLVIVDGQIELAGVTTAASATRIGGSANGRTRVRTEARVHPQAEGSARWSIAGGVMIAADRAGHRWRLHIQDGNLAVHTEGANPEGRAVWVTTEGTLRVEVTAMGDGRLALTGNAPAVSLPTSSHVALSTQAMGALDELLRVAPAGSDDALRIAAAVEVTLRDAERAGPAFYNVPIRGRSIVLVVDVSYSMSESDPRAVDLSIAPGLTPTKLDVARAELVKVLGSLPPDVAVNIVAFSSNVTRLWQNPRTLDPATLSEAIRWVGALQPRDETEPVAAIEAAASMQPEQIVLLSDGRPTDRDTIARALLGLAEGVSSRMRLDVVGIGPDQDRTFLAALAARGRGELRLR
jgi:von Willebrand factor type A domain